MSKQLVVFQNVFLQPNNQMQNYEWICPQNCKLTGYATATDDIHVDTYVAYVKKRNGTNLLNL